MTKHPLVLLLAFSLLWTPASLGQSKKKATSGAINPTVTQPQIPGAPELEDPGDTPVDENGQDETDASTAPAPPSPRPPAPSEVPPPGEANFSTGAGQERESVRIPPSSTRVSIDFVDSDLKDIVKYFAEITGRNFIIDKNLSGTLTIISPKKVTVAEAYEAFLSALQVAGFTTVTVGKITKIVSVSKSQNNPLRIYSGEYVPYTDNFVTRLIKLENVSAADITKVVQGMLGNGGNLTSYEPSNTLIITDSAVNIRRMEALISELDISMPTQELAIIQIQYAEAGDILEKIKAIYGEESSKTPAAVNTRATAARNARDRRGKTPKIAGSTAKNIEGESRISKMIADERTNSIIVLATEQALSDIRDLIARLDFDVEPWARSDIHVVYLRHAKAEDLVQVLTQLTNSATQNRGASSTRRPTTNPRNPRATAGAAGRRTTVASSPTGSGVAEFENDVRVTADPATNALVITANQDDFRRLKRVIEALDIERRQVFVEAVIMEISDSRDTSTGLSTSAGKDLGRQGNTIGVGGWDASNVLGGLSSLATDATLLAGLAVGIFGKAIDVALPGGTNLQVPAFGVILQAVQSDTSANVLSSPNILTLDNQEAEIVVGQTVPFVTSQSRDNNNNPILSITREDVALTLRVTPQISEGRTVTLEVEQEISDVVGSPGLEVLTSIGPSTTKRSAKTVVAVQDNQTIVIGGLMQNQETLTERKVPILGDIPLIGALFRNRSKTVKKKNLLIFLTPHIITNPSDLEEVYRIKIAQRQEFLRRFYGKSTQERDNALADLLQYSMNYPDRPSVYRSKTFPNTEDALISDKVHRTGAVNPLGEDLDEFDLDDDDVLIAPDGSETPVGAPKAPQPPTDEEAPPEDEESSP